MVRALLRGVSILSLLFLVLSVGGMRAEAADKVNFTQDWVLGGFHAGWFVSLDKGIFKRAGIEAEIYRGFGGADTVRRVGTDAATFGWADMGGLVIARSRGTKVKAVAAIFEQTQYVHFTFKDKNIRTPKDMEGKKLACPAGSVVRATTPALMRAGNADPAKIVWETMDAPLLFPSLLAGRVDMACAFWVNLPGIEGEARKIGKEVTGVYYKDYGIHVYSNSILTQDHRIQNQADLVRRFVKAALEGYASSIDNPEEAVDIFVKYQPALDRKIALAQQEIAIQSALTPTAKEKGLGYIRKEKVESTRDIITEYMKLEVKVPVEDLFTIDFLPVPGVPVKGKM